MITLETSDGGAFVSIEGDLDVANAPRLRALVENIPHAVHVRVDLRKCTYIDSTAISMLAIARRDRGDRFVADVPSEGQVRKVLDMCGLTDHLTARPAGSSQNETQTVA